MERAYFAPDGTPNSILGYVFQEMGITLEELQREGSTSFKKGAVTPGNERWWPSLANKLSKFADVELGTLFLLGEVQRLEDLGHPWEVAIMQGLNHHEPDLDEEVSR